MWLVASWGCYAINGPLFHDFYTVEQSAPWAGVLLGIPWNAVFVMFMWSYVAAVFTRAGAPPDAYMPPLSPEERAAIASHAARAQQQQQQAYQQRPGAADATAVATGSAVRDIDVMEPAELAEHLMASGVSRSRSDGRRFCTVCNNFKPERCHHCSACGECVLKMDHHCPWIGNCVGYRNYKQFFLLLVYAQALMVVTQLVLLHHVIVRFPLFGAPPGQPIAQADVHVFAAFVVSLAFIFGVLFLLVYHYKVLTRNMTTLEDMGEPHNVFDLGTRMSNFVQVFGTRKALWPFPVFSALGDGLTFPRNDRGHVHVVAERVPLGAGAAGVPPGAPAMPDDTDDDDDDNDDGGSSGAGGGFAPASAAASERHDLLRAAVIRFGGGPSSTGSALDVPRDARAPAGHAAAADA